MELKELRKQRGLTQSKLAILCGVSSQTVSRWERGTVAPDLASFVALCRVFGAQSMDKVTFKACKHWNKKEGK